MDHIDLLPGLERHGSFVADPADGFVGVCALVNEKTSQNGAGSPDPGVTVNEDLLSLLERRIDDFTGFGDLFQRGSREIVNGKVMRLETCLSVFREIDGAFEQGKDDADPLCVEKGEVALDWIVPTRPTAAGELPGEYPPETDRSLMCCHPASVAVFDMVGSMNSDAVYQILEARVKDKIKRKGAEAQRRKVQGDS